MRRALPLTAAFCLLLTVPSHARGHETATNRATQVAMTGEIIDPQCFFVHNSRGLDHAACATRCAKGGQALSFLEEKTGTIYPLIARTHGANPNEYVLPHVGHRVVVKGVVFARGPHSVLQVQSVTMATAKAKS